MPNKIYLNLTNGIEYLKDCRCDGFVRIQSTALEQHRWDFILQELDYTFLLDLARGCEVEVIDYSAKKKQSRANYQGLPFIKFVLDLIWFDNLQESFVKDINVTNYFLSEYSRLSKRTFKKLKYFRDFLNDNIKEVKLTGNFGQTNNDGNREYYKEILNERY